jgi:hypothetical protein
MKKKYLVHALNAKHKRNRKTNCRKLYEGHLAGRKSEYMVTLDESYLYLQDGKISRRIYYSKSGNLDPKFVKQKPEKFGDKIMIVGALTGGGVVPLIKVKQGVKANLDIDIEDVLKPILEESVAKLYPGELDKVFIHHDMATSHTSRKTSRYAQDLKARLGMTIIDNS